MPNFLHRLQRGAIDIGRRSLLHPLREVADAQPLHAGVGVEVQLAGHAGHVAGIGPGDRVAAPACVSSTLRAIGPSLSSDQHSVIAPVRATRPKVGRSPVTPQRIDGLTMLPPVSLPMAKPTSPAAVAAPGPALDPDEPSSSSHGFIVCPPNQMSFSASAPRLSFATSTAPASFSRCTTTASFAGTRSRNGSAP